MQTSPKPYNQLEEWIQSDKVLADKLSELDSSGLSIHDQARKAFHYLSETYQLPKYPKELDQQDPEAMQDEYCNLPISVIEQIALLRFGEPESTDPRYLVLKSVYLVKHKLVIDLSEELAEYLNGDELQGFGYRGEDIDVELVPVKKGESWFDKGCNFFTKEVI